MFKGYAHEALGSIIKLTLKKQLFKQMKTAHLSILEESYGDVLFLEKYKFKLLCLNYS